MRGFHGSLEKLSSGGSVGVRMTDDSDLSPWVRELKQEAEKRGDYIAIISSEPVTPTLGKLDAPNNPRKRTTRGGVQ